jgi:hypothetical protein
MRRILLVLAGAALVAACASTAPALSPAQAAELNSIRAACAAMGLNPSEAPFIYCVRSLTASAPRRPYAMNRTVVSDAGQPGAGFAQGGDADGACAAIGLNPTTARYSYCVSDLRATIEQANNIGAR